MLVEMRTVEICQAVRVGGEVRRNPVEYDSDVVLMQVIHQVHEILRRTVTRCRSEVTGGLVSPGSVERMLHDGKKFDMREAEFARVFGQTGRDLAISQGAIMLFGYAHP